MRPPLPPQFATQHNAPESQVHRGRVRVRRSDGTEDLREVLVGDAPGAWEMWARELAFALQNTEFVDIGGTVYRCKTVDSVDPIRDLADEPAAAAVQLAMGALAVIRDGIAGDYDHARAMANEVIRGLEEMGFSLASDAQTLQQ